MCHVLLDNTLDDILYTLDTLYIYYTQYYLGDYFILYTYTYTYEIYDILFLVLYYFISGILYLYMIRYKLHMINNVNIQARISYI
jgi:hypothetical protein